MTISPKVIAAVGIAFVLGTMTAASAQTRQPREVAAKKLSRANAAPLRGPTEDEKRWMDRASAASNSGGGAGGGGM